MTLLEDTFDKMLVRANRKALNLGLLASCVETALALRGQISDAAVLDLIAAAMERALTGEKTHEEI